MKRRCLNKNDKSYPRYGGRGITVSKEWLSFENFFRDMGATFRLGLSLERIDNSKGYSKENCKWIPLKDQAANKRNVRVYMYKGRKVTLGGLEKEYGLTRGVLNHRVKKLGWSIAKAIKTPKIPRHENFN